MLKIFSKKMKKVRDIWPTYESNMGKCLPFYGLASGDLRAAPEHCQKYGF